MQYLSQAHEMPYGNRSLRIAPLRSVNCFKSAISNMTKARIFELVYDRVNDNGISTCEINSSESKLN
jgi:hypothetical protein